MPFDQHIFEALVVIVNATATYFPTTHVRTDTAQNEEYMEKLRLAMPNRARRGDKDSAHLTIGRGKQRSNK